MVQKSIEYEQECLDKTKDSIHKKIQEETESRKRLLELHKTSEDATNAALANMSSKRLRKLNLMCGNPYWGRLVYKEPGKDGQLTDVYIGNFDHDGPVTICSILSPVGEAFVQGSSSPYIDDLFLKRRLEIESWKIIKTHDEIDVSAGLYSGVLTYDAYLIEKLSRSSSNRMREMFSTLQKEQDIIIRKDFRTIILLQGVAGSGKTAIALHRIAYLLYRYKDEAASGTILVIGPNAIYLNFISQLLPSLGIEEVEQTTFNRVVMQLCGLKNIPSSTADVSDRDESFVNEVKSFLQDYNDRYFADIESSTLSLDLEGTKHEYKVPRTMLENIPVNQRPDQFERILQEQIIADARSMTAVASDSINAENKASERLFNDLRFAFRPLVRSHRIYGGKRRGYKADSSLADYLPYQQKVKECLSKWPRVTLASLLHELQQKVGNLSINDFLGAALLLKNFIDGPAVTYSHIIVDEAQDLSPLAFFSIASLQSPNRRSMTILGDACQKCDDNIFSWEFHKAILGGQEVMAYTLRRSYRATDEIVIFCNQVLRSILSANDFEEYSALPIGRLGTPPVVLSIDDMSVDSAVEKLLCEADVKIVAVICRSQQECEDVDRELGRFKPIIIGGERTDYESTGVVIASVENVRGLEFDAVVIPDASNYKYSRKDVLTFYVAASRAMHRLTVLYKRELPRFIPKE